MMDREELVARATEQEFYRITVAPYDKPDFGEFQWKVLRMWRAVDDGEELSGIDHLVASGLAGTTEYALEAANDAINRDRSLVNFIELEVPIV